MRIALISTQGEVADGRPLSLQPLAGRSVARRQLDLALALGCERVVCLADSPSPEIVSMQHIAARAGARFDAIAGRHALAGFVKAADEVLVIAPDLLVDAELVRDALGARPGMLTLPADRGTVAGYERIDRDAAWAGVMQLPGSAIDRLFELPPDSDPVSSLMRIAAQSGLRQVLLAPAVLDAGGLIAVRDRDAHERAEKAWLKHSVGKGNWRRPASALVTTLLRPFAPRLLAGGKARPLMVGLGALLATLAAVLAWYEHPAGALATLALAAAAFRGGDAVAGFESGKEAAGHWSAAAAVDALLVGIAASANPRDPQFALFAALVLVFAIRLAMAHGATWRFAIAGDRILVLLIATMAVFFDKLLPTLEFVALAILSVDLFERAGSRLTRA